MSKKKNKTKGKKRKYRILSRFGNKDPASGDVGKKAETKKPAAPSVSEHSDNGVTSPLQPAVQ